MDSKTPYRDGDERDEFVVDDGAVGDSSEKQLTTLSPSERDALTMNVTVDVGDMDTRDKEVLAELARLFEDSFREIVEKNRDYSWSFLTTGAKLAQSDGTPFDNAVRSQAYGLLTRAGDKQERLIENIYGNGEAAVSDPPSQTAREAANYYLFLSFILDNPNLASSFVESGTHRQSRGDDGSL